MNITVLGCGAAYPRAATACSGFLFRSGRSTVAVDLGNGTLANLRTHADIRDLDALVLSHRHADHIADVIPLMYGLAFDETFVGPLTVYSAPDVSGTLLAILGGASRDLFDATFEFRPIEEPFSAGDLRFESFPTVHPVPCFGVRVTGGGCSAVYTADTAYFPELPETCRDADLLISEATFVRPDAGPPDVHLWADEAGKVAQSAEVARLVLTHVWGDTDPAVAVEQAAAAFEGPVEAAVDGAVYRL